MRYHILLAIICLSMLYVTVNSFSVYEDMGFSKNNAFISAKENPTVLPVDAFVEPAQTREVLGTPNGLDLSLEKIKNFKEEKQNVIVETSVDERIFYFNVSISPNATWGYGKV